MNVKAYGLLKIDWRSWSVGKLIPIEYNINTKKMVSYYIDDTLLEFPEDHNQWFILPTGSNWNLDDFSIIIPYDNRLVKLLI